MDESTAKLVIEIGAFVGLAVWVVVMRLYGKMAVAPKVETFSATVRGTTTAEAIAALIASLQQGGLPWAATRGQNSARLSRPNDNSLAVTLPTADVAFEVTPRGNDSHVAASVDRTRFDRRMQLFMLVFALLLMPVVILGVAAILWIFAAPNADPAARWQSVQIVQIVHVLWPPFLVFGLWRRLRAQPVDAVANALVALEAGA
jgi:hypothetical protein